ncbi:MAG: ABC transporter ATP-binding protein [Pseudomonadota bacterium]
MSQLPDILGEGRRAQIAAVSFAGVGEALVVGGAVFAMRDIFAALHGKESPPMVALTTLILAGFLVAIIRVFGRTQAERLGQSFAVSLRRNLYSHYARQSYSDLKKRRTGALSLRFVGDLSAVRGWVSLGLPRIVTACFVLPGAAVTLSLLNSELAMATVLPIVLTILAMGLLSTLVQPFHRKLRSKRAQIAISMMERAGIAPELDLMGRTPTEIKSLDEQGIKLSKLAIDRRKVYSALQMAPDTGAALTGVAILWTAFATQAPPAEAAAALAMIGILISPLRDLAGVWDKYCAWRVARAKCEAVFSIPVFKRQFIEKSGPVEIEFDNVVLRNTSISTSILPGEKILVSGKSGVGKSTILDLAVGLERPDSGNVRFDDSNKIPRTLSISANAPVLQGSVRRALTLGAQQRPEDEIIEEAVDLYEFRPTLERLGGLSARIAESARTLSEGEQLKLHLIRAHLTKPNLIVIDTPLIFATKTFRNAIAFLISQSKATMLVACASRVQFDFFDRNLHIMDGSVQDVQLRKPTESNLSVA